MIEQKKTPRADIEQRRTTGFLLGLALVLALLYVSLEWNSTSDETAFNPIDFDELVHESELVPMSNEQIVTELQEKQQSQPSEQLRIVDDDTELQQPEPQHEGQDGDDDESLLKELEESLDDDNALASMGVDPNNPLNFHIVEDLPQFPGGAVEFMKWLTKYLHYPPSAQQRKVQGKVVAQFIVERDGSISDLQVIKKLDPSCDREALRVLRMMPKWKAGLMDAKPCRTQVCIPIVFKL